MVIYTCGTSPSTSAVPTAGCTTVGLGSLSAANFFLLPLLECIFFGIGSRRTDQGKIRAGLVHRYRAFILLHFQIISCAICVEYYTLHFVPFCVRPLRLFVSLEYTRYVTSGGCVIVARRCALACLGRSTN